MAFNGFDKEIARLVILQRIELATPVMIRLRKIFGRYLFTNFFSKFLVSEHKINYQYYNRMFQEYNLLKKYINFKNSKILSIGAGMCGLELIINNFNDGNQFAIIEKNYVSKKVKYGWDDKNCEAYNNLIILKKFLSSNKLNNNLKIFDFDLSNFPQSKFDVVMSLYSLDYHYDFDIYINYLKKISKPNTRIIFDTIRADHFKSIFKNVEIIKTYDDTVHKSKRIMCSQFIDL